MIDDQQITVADGVGTILRLALAVTIAGVTGNARVTNPSRTKTLTRLLFESIEFLEEALTNNEVFLHTSLIGHCRSRSRIAGFLRRSQLSTRIPFLGSKVSNSLAKRLFLRRQRA